MKITKYDPRNPDLSDCHMILIRPIETVQGKERLCRRCRENPIESTGNAAKYCNDCRAADPHRNTGRKSRAILTETTVNSDFTVTVERRAK